MAFPVFAVIGGWVIALVLVVIFAWAVARTSNPVSRWLWRVGASATRDVVLPVRVQAVRHVIETRLPDAIPVSETNQWADTESVMVRRGMTLATWAQRIVITTRAVENGTLVRVTSTSPQLFDWGQNKRTALAFERHIAADAVSS